MGARQSRRSVDITNGKEGEAAVAAAAPLDGEARLEKIAELEPAPVLKPQLNGDASHPEAHTPDKENQIQNDIGTPENEKDKNNEKDSVVVVPAVNGTESDSALEDKPKTPDSEIEPTTDIKVAENEIKKTKKEKVKKKWSFRSISFSKKDKQKPVKKEENGEYAQVPEETPEAPVVVQTEATENKSTEEITPSKESDKPEEKAPETPVTEPMTNGSTTPESPKEVLQNGDLSPTEQISEDSTIEIVPKPEAAIADLQPTDLPLNGLQIEDKLTPPAEPTPVPVVTPEANGTEIISDESIPVSPVLAESVPVETLPATTAPIEELKTDVSPEIDAFLVADIPVPAELPALIPEVCANIEAAQTPEALPPPLPSNPPPSSFTAFAESTMAVHLSDVQDLPVDSVSVQKVTDAQSADSLAQNLSELVAPFAPDQQIYNSDLQKNIFNVPNENVLTQKDSIPDSPNSQQNGNALKLASESEPIISKIQDSVAVVSPVNNLEIGSLNTQIISEAEKLNDTVELNKSSLVNNQINETPVNEKITIVTDLLNKDKDDISVTSDTQELVPDNKTVSDVIETNVSEIIQNDSVKDDLLENLTNFTNPEHTLINTEINTETLEELVSDIRNENLAQEINESSDILSSDKLEIANAFSPKLEAPISPVENVPTDVDELKSQDKTLSTKLDDILTLNKDELVPSKIEDLTVLSNASVTLESDTVPLSIVLSPDAKEFVPMSKNLISDELSLLPEVLKENDLTNVNSFTNSNGKSEDTDNIHTDTLPDDTNEINVAGNKQIENLVEIVGIADKLSIVPPVFSKKATSREDGDPIVACQRSPLVCGQPIPLAPSSQNEQEEISDKIAAVSETIVEATPVVPVTTENGAAE